MSSGKQPRRLKAGAAASLKVSDRIKVWWPEEGLHFAGTVTKIDKQRKKPHFVVYDDGDKEWLNLNKETFKLLRSARRHKKGRSSGGGPTNKKNNCDSTVHSERSTSSCEIEFLGDNLQEADINVTKDNTDDSGGRSRSRISGSTAKQSFSVKDQHPQENGTRIHQSSGQSEKVKHTDVSICQSHVTEKKEEGQELLSVEVGSRIEVFCPQMREYKTAQVTEISAVGQMFLRFDDTGEECWISKHTDVWRMLLLQKDFQSAGVKDATMNAAKSVNSKGVDTPADRDQQSDKLSLSNRKSMKEARHLFPPGFKRVGKNLDKESASTLDSASSEKQHKQHPEAMRINTRKTSNNKKNNKMNNNNSNSNSDSLRHAKEPLPSMSVAAETKPKQPIAIGTRIEIFWEADNDWYAGTITKRHNDGKDFIEYDDGDTEAIDLMNYGKFRVLVPELVTVSSRVEVWWEDTKTFQEGTVTKQDGTDWGRVEYDDGDQIGWINFRHTPFAFLTGSKRNSKLIEKENVEELATTEPQLPVANGDDDELENKATNAVPQQSQNLKDEVEKPSTPPESSVAQGEEGGEGDQLENESTEDVPEQSEDANGTVDGSTNQPDFLVAHGDEVVDGKKRNAAGLSENNVEEPTPSKLIVSRCNGLVESHKHEPSQEAVEGSEAYYDDVLESDQLKHEVVEDESGPTKRSRCETLFCTASGSSAAHGVDREDEKLDMEQQIDASSTVCDRLTLKGGFCSFTGPRNAVSFSPIYTDSKAIAANEEWSVVFDDVEKAINQSLHTTLVWPSHGPPPKKQRLLVATPIAKDRKDGNNPVPDSCCSEIAPKLNAISTKWLERVTGCDSGCAICRSPIVSKPRTTVCHHIFCKSCIKLHYTKDKNCPVCRQALGNKLELKSRRKAAETFCPVAMVDSTTGDICKVYPTASAASRDISGGRSAARIIECCKSQDGEYSGFGWIFSTNLMTH